MMMMSVSKVSFFVCLLTCFLKSSVSEELKANSGDNVTLQCSGSRGGAIRLLHWTRPDLKSEDFVYFVREKRPYENHQHPSFRGRVELRDPKMKDGDVSLILKNVTISDTGTYECHVRIGEGNLQLLNTISLTVIDSGHSPESTGAGEEEGGGNQGLYIAAGGVGALVLGVILGALIAAH